MSDAWRGGLQAAELFEISHRKVKTQAIWPGFLCWFDAF
jgi:hypothetical protein